MKPTDRILGPARGTAAGAIAYATTHGAARLDRPPSAGVVQPRVFRLRHYLEIVPLIVRRVFVPVMDDFVGSEIPTEVSFRHEAMLGNVPALIGMGMVGRVDIDVSGPRLDVSRTAASDSGLCDTVACRRAEPGRAPLRFVFNAADGASVDAVKSANLPALRPPVALIRAIRLLANRCWAAGERVAADGASLLRAGFGASHRFCLPLTRPRTVPGFVGAARLDLEGRAADLARLGNRDRLSWHFADLLTGRLGCRGGGLLQQSRPRFVEGIIP